MALPDFLIAGVQRGGTTWLYHVLTEHPEIAGATKKEINFFNSCENWQKGRIWYEQFFPDRSGLTGEATPGYIASLHAAQRISEFNPNVKIILCLREPASRAYSAYWLFRDREFQDTTFARAVEADVGGIFSRGLYADQLERLLSYIPRSQIKIIFYETMKADNLKTLQDIFQFLGVDKSFEPQDLNKNQNAVIYPRLQSTLQAFGLKKPLAWLKRTPMGDLVRRQAFRRDLNYPSPDPDTMRALRRRYTPHNARLFSLLGEQPKWQGDS